MSHPSHRRENGHEIISGERQALKMLSQGPNAGHWMLDAVHSGSAFPWGSRRLHSRRPPGGKGPFLLVFAMLGVG